MTLSRIFASIHSIHPSRRLHHTYSRTHIFYAFRHGRSSTTTPEPHSVAFNFKFKFDDLFFTNLKLLGGAWMDGLDM